MGGFYGSIQVRTGSREQVKQATELAAKKRGQRALVGPLLSAWVGVYPQGSGQEEAFGEDIAGQVQGEVFHLVVHDDDVFAYWFWREGRLLDSYWSRPGYFDEGERAKQEAMSGNPQLYEALLGGKLAHMRRLLLRDESPLQEYERLEQFGRLLGMANVATSYEYLTNGERDGIRGWKQFQEVPGDEKDEQRLRQAELRSAKSRLKKSGAFLTEVVKKQRQPRICAVGQGFLVGWMGVGRCEDLSYYSPPWKGPQALDWDSEVITDLVSDSAGGRVALSQGRQTAVWDWAEQRPLAKIEGEWAHAVGLSTDARLLGRSSRSEIQVYDLDGKGLLHRFEMPGQLAGRPVFHPSGRWLVCGGAILIVTDLASGSRRQLYLGGVATVPPIVEAMQGHVRQVMANLDLDEVKQKVLKQFAKLDLGAMQKQVAKHFEALSQKGEAVSEPPWLKEGVEGMRRQMERNLDETMGQFASAKADDTAQSPPRSAETSYQLAFSGDGAHLFCATDKGLRVFDWETLLSTKEKRAPSVRWQFSEESGHSHVHALTEEPGGEALVFGGGSGRLYRMDLADGQVVCLSAAVPADLLSQPIQSLAFSGDVLGLTWCATPGRDQRSGWQAWHYPTLREMFS